MTSLVVVIGNRGREEKHAKFVREPKGKWRWGTTPVQRVERSATTEQVSAAYSDKSRRNTRDDVTRQSDSTQSRPIIHYDDRTQTDVGTRF